MVLDVPGGIFNQASSLQHPHLGQSALRTTTPAAQRAAQPLHLQSALLTATVAAQRAAQPLHYGNPCAKTPRDRQQQRGDFATNAEGWLLQSSSRHQLQNVWPPMTRR